MDIRNRRSRPARSPGNATSAPGARASSTPPAAARSDCFDSLGSSNASSLALVNRLGYTAVGWTVDTLGSEGSSLGQSIGSVTSRALEHLRPGEIILMRVGANPHDHSTLDADALPRIISAIQARGYQFVTLND